MKKFKWTIMTLVILFSVCTAFSNRMTFNPVEYYWNGSGYTQLTGDYGDNFVCKANMAITCTYTFDGAHYTAYRTGSFTSTILTDQKSDKKSSK